MYRGNEFAHALTRFAFPVRPAPTPTLLAVNSLLVPSNQEVTDDTFVCSHIPGIHCSNRYYYKLHALCTKKNYKKTIK